ncbi:MAG: asparagine synthase (glutamine-hydrolyzing) [Bacteroidetes bacterium]|nr:asparagine synthase (glutamine-hydrolyzing) [Bacteroidota bacterium]
MCGIAGIILKQANSVNVNTIIRQMSNSIAHRGPDGEGFLLSDYNSTSPYFNSIPISQSSKYIHLPSKSILNVTKNYPLALLHRRLAIIDRGIGGHQPMCDNNQKNWIVFNGEIYNYIEIRNELQALGYTFNTQSDTEVVLAAYKHWGQNCVSKFNGMWAFCIYDNEQKLLFISRDRLGVKPFYYICNHNLFAFASEQKAFIKTGLIKANANNEALHNYLLNGYLEQTEENFFDEVTELFPGNNLIYNLNTHVFEIKKYYALTPNFNNESLDDNELIQKIKTAIYDAVNIRLRSDVEVGTCLSGGIDSSSIALIMHDILKKPIHCFTSVFKNYDFNEEHFANEVVLKTNAIQHIIEPDVTTFWNDINDLIYSQDVPIWSSSTYAQHRVMQLAKENNIKVLLDGQGADELFAGYSHHFSSQWNSYLRNAKFSPFIAALNNSKKSINQPLKLFLRNTYKSTFNPINSSAKKLLNKDFINSFQKIKFADHEKSINDVLLNDINLTRLKIFLKCEDRAGMWHGVETRTPFSDDIKLIELLFSFDGNRKIKNGISKYFLREAVKDKLPSLIYNRLDKKGFETPFNSWIYQKFDVMCDEIIAANFWFLNSSVNIKSLKSDQKMYPLLFKLFVFSRWQEIFMKSAITL